MWISRVKKYKILAPTQLFFVVFYKLKPIQNTTNITEITENLLNSVPHTLKFKLVTISHLLSTTQNLILLIFLTIVLALNAFLTCRGQQSEQITAPIHLL